MHAELKQPSGPVLLLLTGRVIKAHEMETFINIALASFLASPDSQSVSVCFLKEPILSTVTIHSSLILLPLYYSLQVLRYSWTLPTRRPKTQEVAAVAQILATQLMEWCLKTTFLGRSVCSGPVWQTHGGELI